jgi:hypothetical protein
MDFVYPLGAGSLHRDVEIGFSMKSVRKFVPNAGKIYVVGNNPKTNPGVEFTLLDAEDFHCHKQFNTMEKMKLACNVESISDPFVWMNDDFFFCRQISVADITLWHQGSLKAHIQHRAENPNNYFRALQATKAQLDERQLPSDDFEIHCPFPVHKMLMRKTLSTFDWREGVTPLMRSCYANQHRLHAEFRADLKISEPLRHSEIKRRIGDSPFFSIGDGALVKPGEMVQFMKELLA